MKYYKRLFIEKSKHWRHTSNSIVLKAYVKMNHTVIVIFSNALWVVIMQPTGLQMTN